jgi:hypothetical protein
MKARAIVLWPALMVVLGAMALAYVWLPAYLARPMPRSTHDGFGLNQFSTDERGLIIGNFQDAEMWKVVSALNNNLLLGVSMEEVAIDPKKDGITVAEMVAQLQRIHQTGPLTSQENDTLQTCLRLSESAGDSVIEWKGTHATFDVQHVSVDELFKVIGQNYPEYRIDKQGSGYVVAPVYGGKLETTRAGPIDFQNESFATVLKQLKPVAEAKGITVGATFSSIGPGRADQRDRMADFMTSKITLQMDNPTWLELATALAQATTPESTWSGGEISGATEITFHPQL